jgi:hypothetical protein
MGKTDTTHGSIDFPARRVPIRHAVDVLVVGGGTSGVAAAVAAARQGADVLLVERYGFLGGTAVSAPVPRFQEGPLARGERVIRGIFAEQKARLVAYNAHEGESAGIDTGSAGVRLGDASETGHFVPTMLQVVCLDMVQEAGVRLMLHTSLVDVIKSGDTKNGDAIDAVVFVNKGGLVAVKARQYIDATGDGDLAVAAGARSEAGRPADGLMQPPTLVFSLSNIDFARLEQADWPALWQRFLVEVPDASAARGRFGFRKLEAEGRLVFPAMTHVPNTNAADPDDRTYIEIHGRQQAKSIMEFFRRHVPGCERCYILEMGVEAGVRESRRITGDYVITRDDVLKARKFDDAIGASTSWIDIHEPTGVGVRHDYLPKGDWFELPYRALVTAGVTNLFTVGRCMSCTHEALGALRVIPTGVVTGEAAGMAAALCARQGVAPREVEIIQVQRALVAAGAFVGAKQGLLVAPLAATP